MTLGCRPGRDVDRASSDLTYYDRVAAFLLDHKPHTVCVKCIAKALGARPSATQRAALRLEGAPGFVREYAECSLCGQTRLAVRAGQRDGAPR